MDTNKDSVRTTLDLDAPLWEHLKMEAARQHVPLRRLIIDCLHRCYPMGATHTRDTPAPYDPSGQ